MASSAACIGRATNTCAASASTSPSNTAQMGDSTGTSSNASTSFTCQRGLLRQNSDKSSDNWSGSIVHQLFANQAQGGTAPLVSFLAAGSDWHLDHRGAAGSQIRAIDSSTADRNNYADHDRHSNPHARTGPDPDHATTLL